MTTSTRQRKVWSIVLGASGLVIFALFASR